MSRASLREFQTHLAQRLAAAQSGQAPSRWLAVMAGQWRLLLPLEFSGEISPVQHCAPLPHARPWFLGLTSLRGQVCGVVHLGRFLGAADSAPTAQARLIQFAPALDINVALLVDQLVGLRSPEQLQRVLGIEDQGSGEGSHPWLGTTYRDAEQNLWHEIDLLVLAENEQFLSVT
ncbi:MAG: chemotaxis protein CheW [Thiomonas sp.]|uniref:chemotaxis protein CheW n=1 Tax=Thiomonas sp. TaxID=2047785 RepID=UPI002A36881C|nr:chemotaxis protein CheW [Thiomonas sp.]MDY0330848.1 chemotaxis protein CheW [Thiomonas sp.]